MRQEQWPFTQPFTGGILYMVVGHGTSSHQDTLTYKLHGGRAPGGNP